MIGFRWGRSLGSCLLAAVLGLSAAAEALGVVIYDRIRLQNSRQALTFLRATRREADTIGGMGLKSIEDAATGIDINTMFSPIYQVELRSLDPINYPPLRLPDGDLNFMLLPIDQLELVSVPADPNGVRLTWLGIPVPNSSQVMNVVVRVALRSSDGKAVWQIDASLAGNGPYGIHAVRFPYFGFNVIRDGSDDSFLIPMTGGQVVPNPMVTGNNFPERGSTEGATEDAFFTYPGNVMTQFMAYYDPAAGVYMATEDETGKTKNLYFDIGNPVINPAHVRLFSYFTHFNTALAPTPAETTQGVFDDLKQFSLLGNLRYIAVTDVFNGDWLTATNVYRSWVVGSGARWVSRGELDDRVDIPRDIKKTAYAVRWQLSPTPDEVDSAGEADRVQQTLAFYESVRDLYDPGHALDFAPLALLSQAQIDSGGVIAIGQGDDVAEPLRVGVPEFLHNVNNPPQGGFPVRAIAMNRDTTGIATDSENLTEAFERGIMRNSDLSPVLGAPSIWRTCLASNWTLDRRTRIFLRTIQDSSFSGDPGFTMAAVSGTGNFAFTCYAPLADDNHVVDRGVHNHDIGGGNYLAGAWTNLATSLKDGALSLGIPFLLLGMEHTPETMIRDYILVGRSFSEPYDDTQLGVARTIQGAYPVPLFKYLYHDFNMWPAHPPLMTDVAEVYVDAAHPLAELLLVRFRMAQLAMNGRMLVYRLAQSPEQVTLDGPPYQLPPEVQDEHAYFAAIAALRGFASQYLVFGQALRDPFVTPASSDDLVPVRFIRLGQESTIDEPRILTSAWLDDTDASIGLIFTNYTPLGSQCAFSFFPSEYGLAPGAGYKVQIAVDVGTWVDIPDWVFGGSDGFVTFGPLFVPGMEEFAGPPWLVLRIVPE